MTRRLLSTNTMTMLKMRIMNRMMMIMNAENYDNYNDDDDDDDNDNDLNRLASLQCTRAWTGRLLPTLIMMKNDNDNDNDDEDDDDFNQIGEFAVYKQADREAFVNFSLIICASMACLFALKRKFF